MKAAHHRRDGKMDDPDSRPIQSNPALQQLEGFVKCHFREPLVKRSADTCLYTSTKNDDFILDRHPTEPRIVVGAGFSGHGFKFAPLIGEILATLSRTGRCQMEEFQAMAPQFSFGGPT